MALVAINTSPARIPGWQAKPVNLAEYYCSGDTAGSMDLELTELSRVEHDPYMDKITNAAAGSPDLRRTFLQG